MYGDATDKASMLGVHVDEILFAGTACIVLSSDAIAQRFPSKTTQSPPRTSARSEIGRTADGFIAQQRSYALSLSPLPSIAYFNEFRWQRKHLVWLATTRPDILDAGNILSETIARTYTPKDLLLINQVQWRASANCNLGLIYQELDPSTLHLIVYSDASFS